MFLTESGDSTKIEALPLGRHFSPGSVGRAGGHVEADEMEQHGKYRIYWDKEYLQREYIERGRSTGEISREHGVTDTAILQWLRKHNIPRRNQAEVRRLKFWGSPGESNPMYGITGPAHHRYIDGSSGERVRGENVVKSQRLAARVRERDNGTCQRCGRTKDDGVKIHTHHIKGWAGNEEARYDENNCVTLCKPCHNWTHSNENTEKEYRL